MQEFTTSVYHLSEEADGLLMDNGSPRRSKRAVIWWPCTENPSRGFRLYGTSCSYLLMIVNIEKSKADP